MSLGTKTLNKNYMPNILHINTRYSGGGAAVAAKRLHQGLMEAGCDSRFLVGFPMGALPLG